MGKKATLRRRQRRLKQKLREALGRNEGVGSTHHLGVGAAVSATPPIAKTRPIARVLPMIRPRVEVEAAPGTPVGPEYYAPTDTLTLHPDSITAPADQVPDKYLYLTKRFLIRLRRGLVSNPIPLLLINVTVPNNDFPTIPALVFGPPMGPGGSAVVFYDQP